MWDWSNSVEIFLWTWPISQSGSAFWYERHVSETRSYFCGWSKFFLHPSFVLLIIMLPWMSFYFSDKDRIQTGSNGYGNQKVITNRHCCKFALLYLYFSSMKPFNNDLVVVLKVYWRMRRFKIIFLEGLVEVEVEKITIVLCMFIWSYRLECIRQITILQICVKVCLIYFFSDISGHWQMLGHHGWALHYAPQ